MGTTQRIIPGVSGEPNWGNLNIAVTSIASTIAREKVTGEEADAAAAIAGRYPTDNNLQRVDAISLYQQKLFRRRDGHIRSALKNLLRTGGGGHKIVKGKSESIGKAGMRTAKRFSSFVSSVYSGGLEKVLSQIGFGSLSGRTFQEVIDFLLIYFADSSSGMDEIAANMANCEVLSKLTEDIKSIDELEKKLSSLIEDNKLTEVLCDYYGIYLFEHLSQRFQEKITQLKGEAVSSETFKVIKEDIIGQIKLLNTTQSIKSIDWKGGEGKELEEKIFNSIINLFE